MNRKKFIRIFKSEKALVEVVELRKGNGHYGFAYCKIYDFITDAYYFHYDSLFGAAVGGHMREMAKEILERYRNK